MPGCGMHSGPELVSVARNPDKLTQNKLKTNKQGNMRNVSREQGNMAKIKKEQGKLGSFARIKQNSRF